MLFVLDSTAEPLAVSAWIQFSLSRGEGYTNAAV